jgi:hypothetical protein
VQQKSIEADKKHREAEEIANKATNRAQQPGPGSKDAEEIANRIEERQTGQQRRDQQGSRGETNRAADGRGEAPVSSHARHSVDSPQPIKMRRKREKRK